MSVDTGAGCLLIVKNYTGDRLNFGLAAERARGTGRQVEVVIVSDDIALKGSAQPRGIAGTLFVHKTSGAAAESGAGLAEVAELAGLVAQSVRTLGVSMSGADIPGRPAARSFTPGTAELGLGIHGEPGVETIEVGAVREIVGRMAARLEEEMPGDAPVALLVNNLGGLSGLELGVIVDDLLGTLSRGAGGDPGRPGSVDDLNEHEGFFDLGDAPRRAHPRRTASSERADLVLARRSHPQPAPPFAPPRRRQCPDRSELGRPSRAFGPACGVRGAGTRTRPA